MATISLTLPVSGTVITAGLHSTNYTAIQGAINGGLDTANWASGLIFAPSKFMQEGATTGQGIIWGGSQYAPAGTMVRLSDTTLGADTASFDITPISGSYIALKLSVYARGDTAAAATTLALRFNNDSGANYDHQYVLGSAASATAAETFAATSASFGAIPANTAGANLFGEAEVWVPHYAGAVNNKTFVSNFAHKSGTASGNLQSGQYAGFWRSNAAISRITILPGAGNFKTGSRCTLYGLA